MVCSAASARARILLAPSLTRCLLAALCVAATVARGQSGALSYKDALAQALAKGTGPRAATEEQASAAAARRLAAAADDPRLSVESALTRRYREVGGAGAPTGYSNEQSYGVAAQVPLYDFGRQAAKEKAADVDVALADLGLEEAREVVARAVADAFLAAATAARAAEVADDQARVAREKSATLTRNYKLGLRPESDVVQAQVDLGKAEIARQHATDALTTALASLQILTRSDAPFTKDALRLQVLPAGDVARVVAGWRKDLTTTLEKRQTLAKSALDAERDGVRADLWPTFDAAVTAERAGAMTPLTTSGSGVLRLAWDIPWSGMNRDREAVVARKSAALALAVEDQTVQRRDAERRADDALAASVRLAAALEKQKALAERQMKLVQARYEAGRASALEVSTAEGTLLGVKLDLIQASHDATGAALAVAAARGVTDLEALFP